MSVTITKNITNPDSTTCYLRYPMSPEIIKIPQPQTPKELDIVTKKISEAIQKRPEQIMIALTGEDDNKQSQKIIIFSRGGGITLTLGVEDYSKYIAKYINPEHRIHQFYRNEVLYITIIKVDVMEQLSAVARELWNSVRQTHPDKVMLYIDSTNNAKAELSDEPYGDIALYFDITSVTPDKSGVTITNKADDYYNKISAIDINTPYQHHV